MGPIHSDVVAASTLPWSCAGQSVTFAHGLGGQIVSITLGPYSNTCCHGPTIQPLSARIISIQTGVVETLAVNVGAAAGVHSSHNTPRLFITTSGTCNKISNESNCDSHICIPQSVAINKLGYLLVDINGAQHRTGVAINTVRGGHVYQTKPATCQLHWHRLRV
jgi:hypothetical protein